MEGPSPQPQTNSNVKCTTRRHLQPPSTDLPPHIPTLQTTPIPCLTVTPQHELHHPYPSPPQAATQNQCCATRPTAVSCRAKKESEPPVHVNTSCNASPLCCTPFSPADVNGCQNKNASTHACCDAAPLASPPWLTLSSWTHAQPRLFLSRPARSPQGKPSAAHPTPRKAANATLAPACVHCSVCTQLHPSSADLHEIMNRAPALRGLNCKRGR